MPLVANLLGRPLVVHKCALHEKAMKGMKNLSLIHISEDLAYLEEPYVPHEIVGAIDKNPAQGVILLDDTK